MITLFVHDLKNEELKMILSTFNKEHSFMKDQS